MPPTTRKRPRCQYCKQSFSAVADLEDHLDQFIQQGNAIPSDGIHNIEEIRRSQPKKCLFPFLKLPAEIRNRIYEYMLCRDYICPILEVLPLGKNAQQQPVHLQNALLSPPALPVDTLPMKLQKKTWFRYKSLTDINGKKRRNVLSTRYVLRVLRTCRQIYHEALPVFFTNNHFLFHGHDFRSLIRFIMGSGRERCSFLRHIAFATRPLGSHSIAVSDANSIDISAIIRLRSGTNERNPWNRKEQRRMLIRSLWEYTRPKAVLLPPNHPPNQLSAWEGRDLARIKEDTWSVNEIVSNAADGWPEAPYWLALGYTHEPTEYELWK